MALWQPPSPPPNTATSSSSSPSTNDGDGTRKQQNSSPPPAPASTKIKYQGKRIGQIVKLKPECYDEYKKCHKAVWPEVLKQIKECNIEDYSIFFDSSSHTLYASFKYLGYDYAGDMERMRENDKVREWWAMTDKMQDSFVQGAKSSEDPEAPAWWKGLEEVFYNA